MREMQRAKLGMAGEPRASASLAAIRGTALYSEAIAAESVG
jgi:hypothetical protein